MMNIDLWKDKKDLLIMLAIYIYIYIGKKIEVNQLTHE